MRKHEKLATPPGKHRDSGKGKVRDRIFETASELFYHQGIRCVGVDAIASEAGTNKMSFYRSFASKDELVAEYLREQEREHWEWWDAVIAPHAGDPRRQIEALFESYATKLRKKDTCGCALVNAAVEIRETDHPALAVVHGYKAEMRSRFRALAKALGVADHAALGDALTLLVEGSAMSKLTFPCREGPCTNAAKAAKALIEAHLRGC
jgi:AcrR family transcriptional regulator